MKIATKKISSFLLLLFGLAAMSCSSATKKEDQALDQKLAGEPPLINRDSLQSETKDLTNNTPGLSDAQKQQLNNLRRTTRDHLADINKKSLALRAVLVRDVISPANNAKEIEEIKKRLRKLSDERLDAIFKAVDSSNEILGRNNLIRESMDEEFLEQDGTFF